MAITMGSSAGQEFSTRGGNRSQYVERRAETENSSCLTILLAPGLAEWVGEQDNPSENSMCHFVKSESHKTPQIKIWVLVTKSDQDPKKWTLQKSRKGKKETVVMRDGERDKLPYVI